MSFFSCNALNSVPLKCFSINNQDYRIRPKIININSNINSCNNINDPFAKLYVPDVVNGINVKVFTLMSITNETRHIKQRETCKCKCRLDRCKCL